MCILYSRDYIEQISIEFHLPGQQVNPMWPMDNPRIQLSTVNKQLKLPPLSARLWEDHLLGRPLSGKL